MLFRSTPAQKSIFDQARARRLAGVLLCADERLSYLAPVYTSLRPFRGHAYNTPDFGRRCKEIDALFFAGRSGPWTDDVDFLLVDKENPSQLLPGSLWRTVAQSPPWTLYQRVRPAGRTSD